MSNTAIVKTMQKLAGETRKFKVVLLGSTLVGKTSIVIRFSNGTFSMSQDSTIGSAFWSRDVQTMGELVTLHIWDTAGQEKYKSLVPKYTKGAAAVITVFDVTSPDSFERMKQIVLETKETLDDNVAWFVVGNKTDLISNVDLAEARLYAESLNAEFFETSAKNGWNIDELFTNVAEQIVDKQTAEGQTMPLDNGDSGCC